MKILLVNYEYPPLGGGGGIAVMEFAQELARRHEVHVLTSGGKALAETEKNSTLNLTVHRVRVFGRSDRATASFTSMAAFLPAGVTFGNKLAREIKFDVINTWFAIPSGPVGAAIAKKNNIAHVLTVIGGDIYDPSKWYSPHQFFLTHGVVKKVLQQADAHIAISADIAERTRKYFDFKKPIEVVPLGITPPRFSAASREELGLSPTKKYIVAVGRLVRRKDYPTLLKALRQLEREDVELLLLGDGPHRDSLQETANSLGIGKRVHLKGFVSNEAKYQYLSNSDLFALVSLHEGFGIVYLEAMYCSLPIVAADEGGQVSILENNLTGRLVPAGNVDALCASLRDLLADDDRRREIGEYNRGQFDRFSIAALSECYVRAFEQLVSGEGR